MRKKTRSGMTVYDTLRVPTEYECLKRSPSLPVLVRARMRESTSKQSVVMETEKWLRRRREKVVVERNGRMRQYHSNILLQDTRTTIEDSLINARIFEAELRTRLREKYSSHKDLGEKYSGHKDLDYMSKGVQTGPTSVYRATDRRYRPHSVDMGGLARAKGRWSGVVPCQQVRVRECDEPPEEFKRAGIGFCFQGMAGEELILVS